MEDDFHEIIDISKMKICYLANIRMPTEKAHGIQIMKTCEALATEGHDITLFLSSRKNNIKKDIFEYYSVKDIFKVIYVPSLNILWLGKIGFYIQSFLFSEIAVWKLWKYRPDVIYSRDHIVLLNLILVFKNIFFEAHRAYDGLAIRLLLKKVKLITISHGLYDFYNKFSKQGYGGRIIPDAVSMEDFDIKLNKEEARNILNLPNDKKIALYCGHLYDWKGAQVLADASLSFNDGEIAVFVGGTDHDIELFRERNKSNKKILILGHKDHKDIPLFLKSADVLVLPNSGKEMISSHYTSPMKLFEYMASGVPIVASSLPSIREILDDTMSVFVIPDDPHSLYTGIKRMLDNPSLSKELADNAYDKVKNMTWINRAKAIISFINS